MEIKKISLVALVMLISFTSFAYSLELYSVTTIPAYDIKFNRDYSFLNILDENIGIDIVEILNSKSLLPVTAVIDKAVTSSLKAKQSA